MTVRPISKPMVHHDPDADDDRTTWWCSDCRKRGVEPDHVCKETQP